MHQSHSALGTLRTNNMLLYSHFYVHFRYGYEHIKKLRKNCENFENIL